MDCKVELTARALRDLDEIYEWTKGAWSPSQAERYVRALKQAIRSLANHPHRHAIAPDGEAYGADVRQMIHGRGRNRYRILYTAGKTKVAILHIRHTSRS